MSSLYVISAVGKDKPGLVHSFSGPGYLLKEIKRSVYVNSQDDNAQHDDEYHLVFIKGFHG